MNIYTAHLLLEDLGLCDRKKNTNPNNYACYTCECNHVLSNDGYPICENCGVINFDRPSTTEEVSDPEIIKKTISLYKRRLYVREKLSLMTGYKHSRSKQYADIIKSLKKCRVKNIIHLKQLLKDMNLKKFYKHIYNIFYDIKNIRLIKFTHSQIDEISRRFVDAESKFKIDCDRSNFFSYSSVIYLLMKKYKIAGYQHIILPLNHLQIRQKIRQLI